MPVRLRATVWPPGQGTRRPLYALGQSVELRCTADDGAGPPVAVTGARVDVRRPDGLVVTLTGPQVTSPSTGELRASVQAAQAGTWRYEWVVTGPSEAHVTGAFEVQASPVLPPGPGQPIVVTTDLNPVSSEDGGQLYAQRVAGMPRLASPQAGDLVYGVRGGVSHAIEVGALQQPPTGTSVAFFPTRAAAAAAAAAGTIASMADLVWTAGHTTPGDGGEAPYTWRGTQPAHSLWFANAAPRGGFWELVADEPYFETAGGFGVALGLGEPTQDIAPAWQALLDYCWKTGRPRLRKRGRLYRCAGSIQWRPGVELLGPNPTSFIRGFDPEEPGEDDPAWRPYILWDNTAASLHGAASAQLRGVWILTRAALNATGWRGGLRYSRNKKDLGRLVVLGEGEHPQCNSMQIDGCAFYGFNEAIVGTRAGSLQIKNTRLDANYGVDLIDIGERPFEENLIAKAWAVRAAPFVEGHEDVVAATFPVGALSPDGGGGVFLDLPAQGIAWLDKLHCEVDFQGMAGADNDHRNDFDQMNAVERISSNRFRILRKTGRATYTPMAWRTRYAELSGKLLARPDGDMQARRVISFANAGVDGNGQAWTRIVVDYAFPPCDDPQAAIASQPGWGWVLGRDKGLPRSGIEGVYPETKIVDFRTFDLPLVYDPVVMLGLTGRWLALYPRMQMGRHPRTDRSVAYRFGNVDGMQHQFMQCRGYFDGIVLDGANHAIVGFEMEFGAEHGSDAEALGKFSAPFPDSAGVKVLSGQIMSNWLAGDMKGSEFGLWVDAGSGFPATVHGAKLGDDIMLVRGRLQLSHCQLTDSKVYVGAQMGTVEVAHCLTTGVQLIGLDGNDPWRVWCDDVVQTVSGQRTRVVTAPGLALQSRMPDGTLVGGARTTPDKSLSAGARVNAANGVVRGGAWKWDVNLGVVGYVAGVGVEQEAQEDADPFPNALRFGLAAQWQRELVEGGPRATGTVQVSCSASAPGPVTLSQGAPLRSPGGLRFTTSAQVEVPPGGVATVAIGADTGGTEHNLVAGTVLTLLQPPEYVGTTATVQAPGLAGGASGIATGTVTLAGTPGTVLPQGSRLSRPDNRAYLTTAPATIGGGGTVSVAVAGERGGAAYNAPAARILTVASPPAGLSASATIQAPGMTGGQDGTPPGMRLVYGPPSGLDAPLAVAWERNATVLRDGWTDALLSVAVAPGHVIRTDEHAGLDTAAKRRVYTGIDHQILDPAAGAATGQIVFSTLVSGVWRQGMRLGPLGLVTRFPGPFANEAAAKAAGLAEGETYRVTGGTLAWVTTP